MICTLFCIDGYTRSTKTNIDSRNWNSVNKSQPQTVHRTYSIKIKVKENNKQYLKEITNTNHCRFMNSDIKSDKGTLREIF